MSLKQRKLLRTPMFGPDPGIAIAGDFTSRGRIRDGLPEKAPMGPGKVPINPRKGRFSRKEFPPNFSESLGLKPPFAEPPFGFPQGPILALVFAMLWRFYRRLLQCRTAKCLYRHHAVSHRNAPSQEMVLKCLKWQHV